MTLKLVLRGLWRHKLRTAITLFAVIFGHFLGLIFIAMNGGGHITMIELGLRQASAGHVVLQAPGYQQSRSVELLVPDAAALRAEIEAALPRAKTAMRVFGGGLARTSSDSVGVLLAGVESGREKALSEIPRTVRRGVYLGASAEEISAAEEKEKELWCARPVVEGSPGIRQIVVGEQLARTLKLSLCDKLVLDVQGMGSRESEQFRVVGVFKTGNADLDAFAVHIALADVQRLLHVNSDVHQIAIFVDSVEQSAATAEKLRSTLSAKHRRSAEVLTWDEALPEMAEFMWIDEASAWVFLIILYLIVAIGVVNTMMMSVMERTRELGIMRALGATPWRIMRLVLAEGAVIGVIGVVVGTALAMPILSYLATTGIDLTSYTEGGAMEAGGVAMTVITAKITTREIINAAVAVFLMAVGAALYPALRAARIRVLKAIYRA